MKIAAIKADLKMNKYVYIMSVPIVLYFLIFHYAPMYGIIIAFKEYIPKLGIMNSPWVGFTNFTNFFGSYYFVRILKNTLLLSLYDIFWGFPAPIIFALLLNEIRNTLFKKTVQTFTYMPHFISMVVLCGIIVDFTNSSGLISNIAALFSGEQVSLISQPSSFRTIFIASGIWQNIGWGSIIYLAALTNINPELYNAATIDGAGRFRQLRHVTLPGISSTIIVLLILRIGGLMSVGFEKIILLYSPVVYETADVISSFNYRKGLLEFDYSYSAAVGLFNSVINFILLMATNKLSRKMSDTSLL